jgi:hypothetical protein
MPAFSRKIFDELTVAVRMLYNTVSPLMKHHLTTDEYYQVLVAPEYRSTLRDASKIVDCFARSETFNLYYVEGEKVTVNITTNYGFHEVLMPKDHAVWQDENPECAEGITSWVTTGGDVARDFGRVQHVLESLQYLCSSPAAVRSVWPSVLALCSTNDKLSDLSEKLAENKPLREPSCLPYGLRVAMRKAAGTIAGARILATNDASTPSVVDGVFLRVQPGQLYKEEGDFTFKGYSG